MGNRDSRHISTLGRLLVLGGLSVLATSAWSRESSSKAIDFAQVHADPGLVGKRIRIHACIALSMSDTQPNPGDTFVLYPCGVEMSSDEDAEKNAIGARPVSEAALAPFRNSGVPLRPEIQADFTGRLTFQQVEARDPRKYLVLEFDEMSNLAKYAK